MALDIDVISDLQKLREYEDALLEITEAKGAFNRNPFEHCKNCVRDMHAIAREVLIKHGIEPRRMTVD